MNEFEHVIAPRARAQSTAGTLARHGRLRTTTAGGSVAKGIAMLLGVALVSAVVFAGIVLFNLRSGVDTFDIADDGEGSSSDLSSYPGGVNFLLVGSDERTDQGEEFGEGLPEAAGRLNDVSMIVHLSADHEHATVVSIPRDTLVDISGCTSDEGVEVGPAYGVQFNSLLGLGGMNCVLSGAEELSGLDIQFAAMVKFRGVIEMSNAVGGVDVCVEQPIRDPYIDLNLSPGVHSLQGEEALKFLRSRHGVGDGSDLSRISNQQVFLSALMRKVKSDDTLTNPTRLYALARAVTQNMTLSSNLDNLDVLVQLAVAISEVPIENIAFVRLPVVDSPYDANRVIPDPENADALWELLQRDESPIVKNTEPPTAPSEPGAPSDGTGDTEGPTEEEPADPWGETTDPADPADPTPTPSGPVLDGQTADDERCSNEGDPLF